MDPYERLGISRTSSVKELEQAYADKLAAHPEDSEERTEIERAYVVIKYEKKQKQKRNKRGVGLVLLLVLLGAGGGGYYYWSQDEPATKAVKETKKSTSFVIGEETKVEEPKKKADSSDAPKKADVSESDYEAVRDIAGIFFRELEDALTQKTVKGLSVSTNRYNENFQSSLNDLNTGGYIFDGGLTMADIPESDIAIKGDTATVTATIEYSSRSYQPYLHERPDGSTIVWKLSLVKSGGDWFVSERSVVSDSAEGRGMTVQESVKDDILRTIEQHAMQWETAYENKDVSAFSLYTNADYLAKQKAYYANLDKKGIYWEGDFDSLEYSPASLRVSEVATDLTASVEALSYYNGSYYRDEDDSLVEEDPGEDIPFTYYLKYDLNQEQWFITGAKKLTRFTKRDTTTY